MSESVSFGEYRFENSFGAQISKSLHSIPNYRSLGTFRHRLFHSPCDLNKEAAHGKDEVYNIVHAKRKFHTNWLCKYGVLKKRNCIPDLEKLGKQISKTSEDLCIHVPKYIPSLVEFTKSDPDENFYGNYNWFHTGGCIQQFIYNDSQYLAYVEGKSRDRLHVAPLKRSDQVWCIDKLSVQNLIPRPGKEILQVVCVEKPSTYFMGVRQKDYCVVYKFGENGSISECFNLLEIPVTSFDISSVHDELCIIDVTHRVSFWDMHREEVPMTNFFPSDNPRFDSWHNLFYNADFSVVSIAGRNSLKWMERRSNNIVNSVQLANLKGLEKEEQICKHFASTRNPYLMYVSTNVNLFLLDIRSQSSVIQYWSHHLPSPPLYSCVVPYDEDNEIVCIGNQYPGSIVLAFSSKSESWPPVKLPSRLDSLYSLQASGLYLDPSVKPRMTLSLAGLTYLKCNESSDVELLTQTAASDIFSQSLFEKNTEENSDNLKGLVSTKDVLQASERWNMKEWLKQLSKLNLEPNPPSERRISKQPWQLSKQELLEYKDALAPIILEVWGVDKVNGKSGISGEQKVSAWLDSSFNTVYTSQGNSLWEDE